MKKGSTLTRKRLACCLVLAVCGFTALGVRVVRLHLFPEAEVSKTQKRQEGLRVALSPQRGMILDRRGRVLAMSLRVPSIFADPKAITNQKKFSRTVGRILNIPRHVVAKKIKDRTRRFAWIQRRVDPALGKKLSALDLPGLHVLEESARMYPMRQLASQVMGVVGTDGNGLEGLEKYYDHLLRSQELVVRTERDAKGRAIYSQGRVFLEPEAGASLQLTLDTTIQHVLEKELSNAADKSRSKRAVGIVIEPETGKILAMASYPRGNLNRLDEMSNEALKNRAVADVFEPGSTFKVFSLAAALESGAVSQKEKILCEKGSLVIGRKVIRTHEEHDWLDPEGILKFSDNIGTARIALRTGRRSLSRYIRKFGFGEPTGIDLPGEIQGLLSSSDSWKDIDLATISFGQGIGVTAVQMAAALSAVVNGGTLVRPFLVESATYPDGRVIQFRRDAKARRVIAAKTARRLKGWMESVTDEDGTGSQAAVPGYRTLGKTGTAQKIDPASGTYSNDLVASSFMGAVPASHPALAAFILFDEPAEADFGGQLAAPVFRAVMETSLQYLGIPPDRNVISHPIVSAKSPRFVASQVISRLSVPKGGDAVPDLRGMTMREVVQKAKQYALDIRLIGSGTAVRQTPQPGIRAPSNVIRVYFSEGGTS